MAGYIKSHSNYRLQTRHQVTNDGVIFERDISTVGGVNSFATGQSTIYQSGNFVILVNNTPTPSRHVKKKGWLASGFENDMWDAEVLSEHSSDITGSIERNIRFNNDFLDLRSFAYYGSLAHLVENTISKIITTFPYELYKTDVIASGDTSNTFYEISNPGNIDIYTQELHANVRPEELGHFYDGGVDNYSFYLDEPAEEESGTSFTWSVNPLRDLNCPAADTIFSEITLNVTQSEEAIVIYAYWDRNFNVKYMTQSTLNFHIRPRSDYYFYEDFVDGLDMFGKCLVGLYSGLKNTAKFEILRETDKGVVKEVRSFVFPSGPGGYNLGSDTPGMQKYISNLGKIGIQYDEIYTDNLFRLMTHDSLKNLDWTRYFNGNDGDDVNEYTRNGEKFSSVMRIIGYTFDKEKSYIDSIGYVNTITYSSRENLSDYFLTDSLETDGWVVNTIYPYSLKEYSGDTEVTSLVQWTVPEQSGFSIKRKFSEITSEVILPYPDSGVYEYVPCEDGMYVPRQIEDNGSSYYVDEDGKIYNILKDYNSDMTMTIPEVNNEFMKRFKINSKQLLKKKGTIQGIESLLSLFGFKSRKWHESSVNSNTNPKLFDFEIREYVAFSPPIEDPYDEVHGGIHKIDWYNKCKTIAYNTRNFRTNRYIPYQGLPVAYMGDVDNEGETRKLYPFFDSSGVYDGNMYYQMYGGWIGYLPYCFDVDDYLLWQTQVVSGGNTSDWRIFDDTFDDSFN